MQENLENDSLSNDEKQLLDELLSESNDEIAGYGAQRRLFLKQMSAAGAAILFTQLIGPQELFANPVYEPLISDLPASSMENSVRVGFKVNGASRSLNVDSRMTLLDTLRERLELTGTKKGCDHGQCGACTVIVDGKRVLSCLTLAASCESKTVTTIEGLAKDGKLHPMQAAFVKHDGFQCGFCTPGQICSAVALMGEAAAGEISYVTADVRKKSTSLKLSDEEIRERMSGNLCRCGAYPNIVAAIREVHTGKNTAIAWQFAADDNEKARSTGA
ncbi:2Fe-2S iron-sulfur cluster binding domain-containing protein [Segetibacter sp. 3557_3]|uniref:2Fe-2S iron-sulfur cluster-binding protein n=1 Tax=Segetibacter sp. 3557_3 TaxID=2547429 RepID=UPI001058C079|nr:2Fe-2S iron-sulfur cluster-binding protein [Segetibacter sp. 3557_3]TDH26812.1 2Fe-2S iron-sulfur cluster binding domain-containing protein [Segetibacter sp. 3557_3]